MVRAVTKGIFYLFILTGCAGHVKNHVILEYDTGVWNVEFTAEGKIVTAGYNGNVACRNPQSGNLDWEFESGSFVFDLQSADLDLDGKYEIIIATAQGEVIVLDNQGAFLWKFSSDLPLYNVCTGNLTGTDHPEIVTGGIDRRVYVLDKDGKLISSSPKVDRLVHRLATGNLDTDPYDEILVIEARVFASLMEFSGDSLETTWKKPLKVPGDMANWENPGGFFYPFSLEISDLDSDGIGEVIMGDTYFNKQAVMVTDAELEPQWISDGLPPFSIEDGHLTEFYSTAFVRAADIDPAYEGKEVISMAGGMFRMWSGNGKLIGSVNGALRFSDIEVDGTDLILGSCPNGDQQVYCIDLSGDWKETFAGLEFTGLIRDIKEETARMHKQVTALPAVNRDNKKYDIVLGFGSAVTTEKGLIEHRRKADWFSRKFPYDNLNLIRKVKVMEPTPPLDEKGQPWFPWRWKVDAINGTMTVDEILDKAKWVEENRVPTMFYVGHSCMPFITLETARSIMEVAPKYCMGFQTAEDERLDLIPRFFHHYYRPLANLCLEYPGKTISTKNKGLWWLSSPANDSVYNALFGNNRSHVTMPATEDSNSRTPELNLLARGGLWQAGLTKKNDVSIHGDLFSFNRFHQWENPGAGHPYLRLLVAHTTLGMTRISSRIRETIQPDAEDDFSDIGRESVELFLHMLGKGLVFSPDREDILGYSPLGIVVHRPPIKFLKDAHNGHEPEIWIDDPELHQAVFPHNGNLWGMTNTPDHAFQRIILNKERQFGYQVPATPFGLVAIVPEYADLDDVANVNRWWHTDGISIWQEGEKKLTGSKAADALTRSFESAAAEMPFRQLSNPVFMNVVRLSENEFRLFLVDPGWVDPAPHQVQVSIQMEGSFNATLLLSGETLEIRNNVMEVPVPAGLFTIVDVHQK